MAKETVGVEVDVKFQSVGNMKKELRAATSDLIAMNEKFGASSKEATEAARRVAKLKDSIGDAKALADTFNPDKKFVALGGALQGAVSGFSALQGAMGLFGDKGKEVEAMLLKVQSAMALQQGISGVAGAMDAFGQLAGKIKTQVVTAFTTLKGAMMATGIGLITAAVAFLVTNFDKVKKTLTDLFPALENMGSMMDRLKQIAMGVGNALLQFLAAPVSALIKVFKGDFSGAFEAVKNGMSFVKNFREGEQKEIKSQADEREKIRQEEIKKEKEKHDKLLEQQKAAAEQRRKAREEEQKKIREEREKQRQEQLDFEEQQRQDWEAAAEEERNQDATRLAEQEANFQKGIDLIGRLTAKTIEDNEKKKQSDREASQNAILNAQVERDMRIELLNQIGYGLSALADLVGKQTAAGKALALAEIAIGTATGFINGLDIAQKTAKSTGPAAAFAFPIFYATQIAAVLGAASRARSVLKAGGSNPTPPSIDAKAPMMPTLSPTVQTNVQNAQAINQMSNQSTRAYVLNSDIQNEQQRNAYLQRNASI